MPTAVEVLLTLSNLAFVVPATVAFSWGHFLLGFVYASVVPVSASYHLCDSFGLCMFRYSVHRLLDYTFAGLTVPLTGLIFVYWRDRPEKGARGVGFPWLHKLFALYFAALTAILIVTTNGSMVSQIVLFGAAVLLIGGYWFVYWVVYERIPHYDWTALHIGLNLTLLSLLLFVVNSRYPSYYWGTHSLWHIFSAFGQAYIVRVVPPVAAYLNAEARVGKQAGQLV